MVSTGGAEGFDVEMARGHGHGTKALTLAALDISGCVPDDDDVLRIEVDPPQFPGSIEGDGRQNLARTFEDYCGVSGKTKAHLTTAALDGATIELQQSGKICHCVKKVVHISQDACVEDTRRGLASMDYMAQSALFELNNALLSAEYQKWRLKARGGRISLQEYGLQSAKTESNSTKAVVPILTELQAKGETLSSWGTKQIAQNPSTHSDFPAWFAEQSHVADAKVGESSLQSKHMYAYNFLGAEVKEVKAMGNVLRTMAKVEHRGFKKFRKVSLSAKLQGWSSTYSGVEPAQFLVWLVFALKSAEGGGKPDWKVEWKPTGTTDTWDTLAAEFARAVPTVNRNRAKELEILATVK